MAWAFPFGAEEFQIFVGETEEQIQLLENGLLDLERNGPDPEQIATIFRAAHTLKGAAGTVGHQPLADLTHAFESVLDGLRSGTLAYAPGVGDALLTALDRLRAMQADIAAGGSAEADVTAAAAALKGLLAGEPAPGPKRSQGRKGRRRPLPVAPEPDPGAATGDGVPQPAGAATPPAAGVDPPPTSGQAAATESAPGPAPAGPRLRVTVRLVPGCAMAAVRAYQVARTAEALGQVSELEPSHEDLANEHVTDQVRLSIAGVEPEALRPALAKLPDVAEVEITAIEAERSPAKAVAPVQSVRVDVTLLDRLLNLVGELVVDRTRLSRVTGILANRHDEVQHELGEIAGHLWRVTTDLQDEVMRARLLPVETLFRKFPRLVRDAARQTGKDIEFVMQGQDTELDRSVLDEIGDPLMHLLRNAVDHGVEGPAQRQAAGKPAQGTVRLAAEHKDNHIVITVSDDGAGIDPARLRTAAVAKGILTEEAARRLSEDDALHLIFAPGFTTREQATALSGRGVGMDVVRRNIERLNGTVTIDTALGSGTSFVIRLPLTLAILHALLVRVRNTALALPLHAVVEVARAEPSHLQSLQGREVARLRGSVLPLIRGCRVLGERDEEPVPGRPLIHVHAGDQPVALLVDELLGEQEVVIKGLDRRIGAPPGFTGAAVLADGQVALVVDPVTLLKGAAAVA